MDLCELNQHFAHLNWPFNYDQESEVKDFNYEVDALEDEHMRPNVVTTKVMEGHLKIIEQKVKEEMKQENEQK